MTVCKVQAKQATNWDEAGEGGGGGGGAEGDSVVRGQQLPFDTFDCGAPTSARHLDK